MADIYYVDPQGGNDDNSGLSEECAVRSFRSLNVRPGVSVLFRRGSVTRGMLAAQSGSAEGGYITYGAYGEGEKPVFTGSVQIGGDESAWVEESPSVWRYEGSFDSEVCNLIYDGGADYGPMRWEKSGLRRQGDWYFTHIGFNSGIMPGRKSADCREGRLYMRSEKNPATYYRDIECAVWGRRRLAGGRSYIIFEGLRFMNSGVHGYQEERADHIRITDCEFRFIGGAVWSIDEKIRFGNAVELWDGATDVEVTRCDFSEIYDAGVTHQGGDESDTPRQVFFRDNRFEKCGLAAYECRGPAAEEVYFERNVCERAGEGFSTQKTDDPRTCETEAAPNNHVLVWRIAGGTQCGHIYIRDNVFDRAVYGGIIHSVIDPADERHFVIDRNRYIQPAGGKLMRWGGRDYRTEDWARYRKDSGNDAASTLETRPAGMI